MPAPLIPPSRTEPALDLRFGARPKWAVACLPERNLVKSPTSDAKAAAGAGPHPLMDWSASTPAERGPAATAALHSARRASLASPAASTPPLSAAGARMPPPSAGRTLSSHLRRPHVQYFLGFPAGVVPP